MNHAKLEQRAEEFFRCGLPYKELILLKNATTNRAEEANNFELCQLGRLTIDVGDLKDKKTVGSPP